MASHAEELGDLRDTADVLLAVLGREAEILVETSADDIAIENEDLLVITNKSVELFLESLGKSGLAGTGETSEPVSGTRGYRVGSGWGSSSFDHFVKWSWVEKVFFV